MASLYSDCSKPSCSGDKRKYSSGDSDEDTKEAITSWKKAFKSFSCRRRLKLPMKRTLLVHWKDFMEGFFVRESEEVIFKALEGEGKMCYSGDMFDNWIYFSPVEMKEKDWYTKSKDIKEITDEKILSEIHHLAMAFKAAQLEESPESSPNRQDEQTELGHSEFQADNLKIHPSHMAYLYWEARAQGFHNLRGKLFAEAFLRFLFTGIENVNVSYSTAGYDSHLDRWGYIQDGPTERLSGYLDSSDHNRNPSDTSTSKDKYRMMLKNLNNIAFNLKAASQKVTSDVFVSIGNDLALIAEVANVSDIEYKKMQQLHTQMLLSLDKHETLFGMLVQGHQVYLAEYTFEQAGGYQRQFSQKAFKYHKEDLKLLYSYLQTHFLSKQERK